MAKRSFYVKDSELDDYQVKVINKKTDNSYIVKGCAGSGKSILALWKAKQIQDEHRGSYMYIVFTKALMQYMADGIKEVGISQRNVDYHWHWVNRAGCPSADYIIVDEAQDFSKEDIELFKSKARKALLLYGDSAQQLYTFIQDKKTVSMEDIQYFTKFPVEQLVFNHRLPKKIARVAQYINSENDELEERCTVEGTEKPKILEYPTVEKQYDAIIELIQNKHMEDVGILFRQNDEVEEAYNYFQEHGLNVEAKFGKHMDLDFTSDNPKLMTYHSSKGLQFENVFLPDCTVEDDDNRNPLYVAVTRTYQSLYILHSGNLSSLFDDVPRDLYDTSLVVAGPKLKL
ncbi:UvrD-like helicase C-terminal domain-containing protein [Xylanibacter ruminicola]|jgi:superfamily I DNA/RNA helicase|uniref:DNA 3'-5' helicase II n=1 Tax=Xylanibacter ruminicola TaxID=839 RepID=A0A1H5S091_XYLRU|nr:MULTISPECIES: ATP-binding domain-containing protein [Prevotellaceae]UKK49513.1 ATP-binding domain-containing protein [Prevotella sp. E9-3]SEF43191.1 UvrD-like helicase C-terminal domain-containing protein [Xylanibacter ruminicola]